MGQTGRAAPGTDTQEEQGASWQKQDLAQNTAALPVQVTYLTGTPLWLKASCRGQFTLNVQATPSMIPFPSRSSTVATTMFITSPTRPIVMRASVVLIEISFLCNFILYAQFSYGLKSLEMSCPVFSMCQSAMTSFREENIC